MGMSYLLIILHVKDLNVVRLPAIVLGEASGTSNPLHPHLVVLTLKHTIHEHSYSFSRPTGSDKYSLTTPIARA